MSNIKGRKFYIRYVPYYYDGMNRLVRIGFIWNTYDGAMSELEKNGWDFGRPVDNYDYAIIVKRYYKEEA